MKRDPLIPSLRPQNSARKEKERESEKKVRTKKDNDWVLRLYYYPHHSKDRGGAVVPSVIGCPRTSNPDGEGPLCLALRQWGTLADRLHCGLAMLALPCMR